MLSITSDLPVRNTRLLVVHLRKNVHVLKIGNGYAKMVILVILPFRIILYVFIDLTKFDDLVMLMITFET